MGFLDRLADTIDKILGKIPGLEDKLDSIFGDVGDTNLIALGQKMGGFIGKILQYVGKKEANDRPVQHSWYKPGTVFYNPKNNPGTFPISPFEQKLERFANKVNRWLRGWPQKIADKFTSRQSPWSNLSGVGPKSVQTPIKLDKLDKFTKRIITPLQSQITAYMSNQNIPTNPAIPSNTLQPDQYSSSSAGEISTPSPPEIISTSTSLDTNSTTTPPNTNSTTTPPNTNATNTNYIISAYKNLEVRSPPSEVHATTDIAKKIYKAVNGEGLKFL